MIKVDNYDLNILRLLSEDGRITKSKLAEKIHLSIPACSERVKRLETAGVITGYSANIDINRLRPLIHVCVEVTLNKHGAGDLEVFEKLMIDSDSVVQCVATGGGVDYVFMVQATTIQHYQEFIDDLLARCDLIEKYFTYIVTKWIKQTSPNLSLLEDE